MPRQYAKTYLSKNGNNYYLQFHVADWMRTLPAFTDYPKSRKNFKKSLRTSDFYLAARKAEKLLLQLQIKQRPSEPPLAQDAEAYFDVLNEVETLSDIQLEEKLDSYWEAKNIATEEDWDSEGRSVLSDSELFNYTDNAIKAANRELEKRKVGKFFDKPHPHLITISFASDKFIQELADEGKSKKTLSKVRNAVTRFLEFREVSDIELKRITSKLVNDYVKLARKEQRSLSSFKSDIHYLRGIFRWAIQEGYLENLANPFLDVRIRGLREKKKRQAFTNEMLERFIKSEILQNNPDLYQLFWVSYYTGMRISEIYDAKIITEENTLCFDVATEGGKTAASPRLIPIHNGLTKKLKMRYDLNEVKSLEWSSPNSTALGKKFGHAKNIILKDLVKLGDEPSYVHHSFRHGFSTMLLQAGYHELQITDLTGHEKGSTAKTEAGKSYFKRQDISTLSDMVSKIPQL